MHEYFQRAREEKKKSESVLNRQMWISDSWEHEPDHWKITHNNIISDQEVFFSSFKRFNAKYLVSQKVNVWFSFGWI